MSKHFNFKAIDHNGRLQSGHMQANNTLELESHLNAIGMELIRCHEKIFYVSAFNKTTLSRRELMTFTFQMQQLHKSGVSILDSLKDLIDSAENKTLKNILSNIYQNIHGGKTFSLALAEFPQIFSPVYIALIKVGEETGRLAEVMQSIADNLKWQDELASQTKKILIYPAIVCLTIFSVLMYLMIFLVPELIPFINELGGVIPLQTQALISTSEFLQNYFYFVIGTPLILFICMKVAIQRIPPCRYFYDDIKLRLYIIGPLILKSHLARFSNYFAMMYSSGLSILDSLKTSEALMGNAVLCSSIAQIRKQIMQGEQLSSSFAQHPIYPLLLIRMLKVGETTGALDEALLNISYFYNREVKESIDKMQESITPLLSIIMGGILLWIMSAVLSPIYDSLSTIS